VAEFLGWNVLDGQELVHPPGVAVDAAGDTIINGKLGVRFGFGARNGGPRPDLYVGYGRALTGEVWYKDIIRLELRVPF
jgi:hypothetical protein